MKEIRLHFDGDINVPNKTRIIKCYMTNEDYSEDLKLEIIHAIKQIVQKDVF